MAYTKSEIISILKNQYEKNKSISHDSCPQYHTAKRLFGSWSNALTEAGIPLNKRDKLPIKITVCINCQIETQNPKFCNRSCAAVFNNKNYVAGKYKRREIVIKQCKKCNLNHSLGSRRTTCDVCYSPAKDYTLDEAQYKHVRGPSLYALVRGRARTTGLKQGWTECRKCGYNKHFEISHIKAITSFPLDTLVSVINDPSNLQPLCPNCHWEHDNPDK